MDNDYTTRLFHKKKTFNNISTTKLRQYGFCLKAPKIFLAFEHHPTIFFQELLIFFISPTKKGELSATGKNFFIKCFPLHKSLLLRTGSRTLSMPYFTLHFPSKTLQQSHWVPKINFLPAYHSQSISNISSLTSQFYDL